MKNNLIENKLPIIPFKKKYCVLEWILVKNVYPSAVLLLVE